MGILTLDNALEVDAVPLVKVAGTVLYTGIEVEMSAMLAAVDKYRIKQHTAGIESLHRTIDGERAVVVDTEVERTHRHLRRGKDIVDQI